MRLYYVNQGGENEEDFNTAYPHPERVGVEL